MERDCLICGQMICGCKWHRRPYSLAQKYGLCQTCYSGLSNRVGEVAHKNSAENEEHHKATRTGNLAQIAAITAKLREWSHAPAPQRGAK